MTKYVSLGIAVLVKDKSYIMHFIMLYFFKDINLQVIKAKLICIPYFLSVGDDELMSSKVVLKITLFS